MNVHLNSECPDVILVLPMIEGGIKNQANSTKI